MGKASCFMVMVNLIVFSHLLLFSTAIPLTRIQGLAKEAAENLPTVANTQQIAREVYVFEELGLDRRMDLEINDYASSGANNNNNPSPGNK